MIKSLKYTSFAAVSLAMLAACTSDEVDDWNKTLNGGSEKTPLEVTALLDAGSASQTRAADKDFTSGDEIVAYLRHVTWDGPVASGNPENSRTSVSANKAPRLVTFTTGASETYSGADITPIGTGVALGMTSSNTKQAAITPTEALYWDDFSESSSADKDLRTDKHYLESYYGYCYNGGTTTSNLVESTGVLGWTVDNNQYTNGIKTSDLLWSAEQTPVDYKHVDANGDLKHGTIVLPFTHAMSKVTIELILGEGFAETTDGKAVAFGNNATTPTLLANRVTTTTAPTYTHSTSIASGNDAKIQMRLADDEVTYKKHRVYEAIIAPTVMKNDQTLAEVTVDGNTYKIDLKDAVLNPSAGTNKWSSKLKAYTTSGTTLTKNSPEADYSTENGGITLPGVNYRITVTLNKQKIDVAAYIKDWDDVYATTTGTISFNADVVTSEVTGATEVKAGSFDLWRSIANTAEADYDNDTSTSSVIDKASTYTYSSGKWVGDPAIYWENGTTKHFFRALAKAKTYGTDSNGKTTITEIETVGGSTSVAQTYDATTQKATSVDLLWAQTSEHKAKDANGDVYKDQQTGEVKVYEAGGAIDPRSGEVPLTFQHAMSKISITLATTNGADAVTGLDGATVSIINLYDQGTISVKDGTVSNLSTSSAAPMTINKVRIADMKDFLVVPQSLVKLNDNSNRDLTPTFYSSEELTGIYSDGTSLVPSSPATPTYYLTSDLTRVDAVLYSEEVDKITEHNAGLSGAVSTESVKHHEDAVPYSYIEFNDDKVFQNREVLTEEIFNDIDQSKKVKTPAVKDYYNETIEGFNQFLSDLDETKYQTLPESFRKNSEGNGSYTLEEFKTYFSNLTDEGKQAFITNQWITLNKDTYRVNPHTSRDAVYYTWEGLQTENEITADLFNALPDAVKIKTPEINLYYTAEEAVAYNSKLPGAWHEGEVKTPAYYKLPDGTTLTSYEPGSLKNAGNKIMLYVYLADGTRYSADLSTCLVANDSYVSEPNAASVTTWEGNKHYNYKITLTKAKIELRALIKDWVEYKVSGDATLDWD